MVFTKGTNYIIKTSESSADAYRRFIAGDFDHNKETQSEQYKEIEKKKLRHHLIQLIMDRYPLDYDTKSNFARFTDHELTALAEFGDHRAIVDPEFIDIDASPTYYSDPHGKVSISHNEIDYTYKDKHQEEIAWKIKGFSMIRSLRYTTTKKGETKHLTRMKDYEMKLRRLPIKYNRIVQFLLKEKLEEIAISSTGFYQKKANQYLAAVVLELMNTQDDETVAKVGPNEICQDFGIEMKGFYRLHETACDNFDFIEKTKGRNKIAVKRELIRSSAQNSIYELALNGFICQPRIVNEFISEMDSHYHEIFNVKKKQANVIALIAAKLFDSELNIREMATAMFNQGISDEDSENIFTVKNQVSAWIRRNNRQIANDIETGRIRDLYINDVDELNEIESIDQSAIPQPLVVVNKITTTGTSIQCEYIQDNFSIELPFEFTHDLFSDRIIYQNNRLLGYLSDNNLLDSTSPKICSRTKPRRRGFRSKLKMNSVTTEVPMNNHDSWGPHSSHIYISHKNSYGRLIQNRNMESLNENSLPYQIDEKSSKPSINFDNNFDEINSSLDYCYLGYPGAVTRSLALLSARYTNTVLLDAENSISSKHASKEGQNPPIIWLQKQQTFFQNADQVMMKKDGLFGKWRQYVDQFNVQFLDDLQIEIEDIYQLHTIINQVLISGSINNQQKLPRNSVIVFPDLRKLLYNELESAVLRMAPNDFVRMKQHQHNTKIKDLEKGKIEKIQMYQQSLEKEYLNGIYKDLKKGDIQKLLDDFVMAQDQRFNRTKQNLLRKLKDEIDEFINCKHKLEGYKKGTDEYREIHRSMYKYQVIISEEIKSFYNILRKSILKIKSQHGITILLGGVLSQNIKTSQLLQDSTLNLDQILDNSPETILDKHMVKLCSEEYDDDNQSLQLARVLSTRIPDKYTINSYKLPRSENEKHGLQGKWTIDETYNIMNLVQWVN